MSQPKITDVSWFRASMVPEVECIGVPDPDGYGPGDEEYRGTPCGWAPSRYDRGPSLTSAVKRHALEHPGHVVLREDVTRTTYEYRPQQLTGPVEVKG